MRSYVSIHSIHRGSDEPVPDDVQGMTAAPRRSEGATFARLTAALAVPLLGLTLACSDSGSDAQQPSTPPAAEPATPAPAPAPEPEPTDTTEATPAEPPAEAEVDWSGGDAASGKETYGLYCSTCHGPSGAGDGPGAAALEPKPRDFTTGAFLYDADGNGTPGDSGDLARVVRDGAAKYGGSANMAPWGLVLPEDQLRDVVAYVQSLKK